MKFHRRLKADKASEIKQKWLDLYFEYYKLYCLELEDLDYNSEYIIICKSNRHLFNMLDIISVSNPKIIKSERWLGKDCYLEVRKINPGLSTHSISTFKTRWIVIPRDLISNCNN